MPGPAGIYDLKGLDCPLPVRKARKRQGMPTGSRLWLEMADPLAAIDNTAFLAQDGHVPVETQAVRGGRRFLVERG
ncbi:hypothetical protein [Mesorhizobium sp. SP-1A]|uniref:sulfurtransferase TusA family protein n=1 Tax=Mesorhizobium sp. SP-1A TaxID=3077840 RepID=UPI0028F6D209|nr:hypothetical protein [Mesorhizobium sp. SP-1A]